MAGKVWGLNQLYTDQFAGWTKGTGASLLKHSFKGINIFMYGKATGLGWGGGGNQTKQFYFAANFKLQIKY